MLNKMMKKFNNKKGFTMIELIAVMAVIAVLITILLPQVGAIRDKADLTEARKLAKEVLQAAQTYDLENGAVPATEVELFAGGYKKMAGRVEGFSTFNADDYTFSYQLVKRGKVFTVTYSGATREFEAEFESGTAVTITTKLTAAPTS